MKICTHCKIAKKQTDYYKKRGRCKSCFKNQVRNLMKTNGRKKYTQKSQAYKLGDGYIKGIFKELGCENPTQEMIEVKREILKIKRYIKNGERNKIKN